MLSFTENDSSFIFDLEKNKKVNKLSCSLKIRPFIPSILSGKILEDSNKVITFSLNLLIRLF